MICGTHFIVVKIKPNNPLKRDFQTVKYCTMRSSYDIKRYSYAFSTSQNKIQLTNILNTLVAMENKIALPPLLYLILNNVMEEGQRTYVLSLRQNVTFGYSFDSLTLVSMPYELYSKWIKKIIALIHYLRLWLFQCTGSILLRSFSELA